jgi:hypothetical protein
MSAYRGGSSCGATGKEAAGTQRTLLMSDSTAINFGIATKIHLRQTGV